MRTNDSLWYYRYKIYRDKINHLIRRSKRNYYLKYFDKFRLNSKKTWTGIKEIINNTKNVGSSINLKINGKMVTDQRRVANRFNDFFINVSQSLVDQLGRGNKAINDYLLHPVKNTIFLKPTDAAELNSLISQLDETKTTNFYGIPVKLVKLVKLVRHTISEPLSMIFNQSFGSGIFPEKSKLACITPIHKGNLKLALTNYRSISVLPVISKLLEQLMYDHLFNFLNKNKILYDHQFGFQKQRSTSMAILDIYSKLIDSIEQKKFSCSVFLDFAKAFDTVNHNILLRRITYKTDHKQ